MNFQCETTSVCDLTCSYCPNKDMERKREFMSEEVWNTILHQYIVPYKEHNRFCPPTLIPHKDGESLLFKGFGARLKNFSTVLPDMKIDIYSHGLMLPVLAKQGRDFMELLGSLPNQVRYMMSHHPRNHDESVNDYTATIKYLQEVLTQRRPPNVEFITVSHRSKWVSEDMQNSWRELWQGLPITVHCNVSINPWTGRIDEGTVRFNGCPYGDFGHWFFGVTGNIIACCLDLEEEIVLGNVLKDDPAAMFARTAEFYADQRRTQETKGRPKHQVCMDCFGYKREDRMQLEWVSVQGN